MMSYVQSVPKARPPTRQLKMKGA